MYVELPSVFALLKYVYFGTTSSHSLWDVRRYTLRATPIPQTLKDLSDRGAYGSNRRSNCCNVME